MAPFAQADAAGLSNSTLALIVNDADPQSVEVASYYQAARKIPDENIIHTRFNPDRKSLTEKKFLAIQKQVQDQIPAQVQAFALTWTQPYKVECMSITSAFALGFNRAYCAKGCQPTRSSPYYDSQSSQPYQDFGIRPTMMLAGKSTADVRALIDRGVKADSSRPSGRAYLVSTSDKRRNVRAVTYEAIANALGPLLQIDIVKADFVQDKTDVLFYFTGAKHVEALASNRFLPGAIADHLTSSGGVLFGDRQMSALRWLEAGASGSYGTVTEPCNFPGKFPNPSIAMQNYLNGDTLIEAYWKSVAMPGQGIFIGEPLSSPYQGCRIRMQALGFFAFVGNGDQGQISATNTHCQ